MNTFIKLVFYISLGLTIYPLYIASEYLFLYLFSNIDDPLKHELVMGSVIGLVYSFFPAYWFWGLGFITDLG